MPRLLYSEENYPGAAGKSTGGSSRPRVAGHSMAAMEQQLQQLLGTISNPQLQELARVFRQAPYYQAFCLAPAAQSYHHNHRGGLLQHSLGTARIVLKIAELYPEIDRDLLLLGAILHDVGKVKEMECGGDGITYTDEGKLLGHIVLGLQMLERLMEQTTLDEVTRTKLLHLVASHHGRHEWQSPRKPQFVEAKILHLADMMDAEIWKYQSARPSAPGSDWSAYMRSIGSEVYLR